MQYTSNYNLKKPEGTDIVNIDDLNDNADILDQKLKEVENKADNAPPNSVNDAAIGSRTPDQSQAPASPGTGTLTQLISWLANRINAITGKTNWWDAPPTTLQAAKNHIDAAAPHSGHETPSGAQAKVDTHAGSKQTHGISSGYYIAKTSRSDQLPAWNDIEGKPSSFTPSAHKTTHAIGGSDALSPGDIGAETPAGAQAKAEAAAGAVQADLAAHLADYVKQVPYGVATGPANAYAVTLSPAPTAYTEGMAIAVKINVENTGPSTINVNGLGAVAIKKPNGLDVAAGNLKANSVYTMRYNGVNFILQGEMGVGTAQPADVLSGKTFTNDQGEQTGTMPNRGAVVITPSTTNQVIAAGYHNGSGYVKGDANLVARNVKKGVSIFGVSGSVKPGWVLFAANGLYNNYNWGNFVAGYANGTPWSQEISSNKISLDTGSSCSDVAMVTNDPIDLTGIDYVCAVIDPSSYGAVSTYLIVDTNKVAPYSTYVARVSGASDAGDSIQGLVLNVSSLSGLYYIRLHLAATSCFIHCYLVSLG